VDRDGPVLTQDALLAQHPADVEDEILEFDLGPANAIGDRWPIGPVDLIEGLVAGALQRPLDGAKTASETLRNRALGGACSDASDYRPTLLRDSLSGPLAMSPALNQPFSASVLTRRLWHSGDPHGVALGRLIVSRP